MTARTARIRALNDHLRTTGVGGQIVVTCGIAALDAHELPAVFAAVQTFAAFTPDNDPYGEHDFGLLQVMGQSVMFKIDYYDCDLLAHSPDPSNPAVTRRVLTIMLASEY
jgi:hypothetical protein